MYLSSLRHPAWGLYPSRRMNRLRGPKTAVLSKTELPADEVRGLSREFASGIGTHRCLAAESGDAGGQQQRHAHDDRYAPPRHART